MDMLQYISYVVSAIDKSKVQIQVNLSEFIRNQIVSYIFFGVWIEIPVYTMTPWPCTLVVYFLCPSEQATCGALTQPVTSAWLRVSQTAARSTTTSQTGSRDMKHPIQEYLVSCKWGFKVFVWRWIKCTNVSKWNKGGISERSHDVGLLLKRCDSTELWCITTLWSFYRIHSWQISVSVHISKITFRHL